MAESDYFEKLIRSVFEGDAENCREFTEEALVAGLEPLRIIDDGLSAGIKFVGEKFGMGELFLPDLMMAVEAMREGLKVVEPKLSEMKLNRKSLGTVVIGTVNGDIHDIGKSIVATMLELNGYEVIDLGVNVAEQLFLNKAKELNPHVIGLSALLSTTMREQKNVIIALAAEGLREKAKVIVGGAPVSADWAEEIGADGFAANAELAVQLVNELVV